MKKLLALLLAFALMFSVLAGCGSSEETADKTDSAPTETQDTALNSIVGVWLPDSINYEGETQDYADLVGDSETYAMFTEYGFSYTYYDGEMVGWGYTYDGGILTIDSEYDGEVTQKVVIAGDTMTAATDLGEGGIYEITYKRADTPKNSELIGSWNIEGFEGSTVEFTATTMSFKDGEDADVFNYTYKNGVLETKVDGENEAIFFIENENGYTLVDSDGEALDITKKQ